MPTLHSSIVGGSTAARRLGCPGSRELELTMPDNAGEAAKEGTALHSAIEYLLDQPPTFDPKSLVGQTFDGVKITRDHVSEALVPALRRFDELFNDKDFEVEITKPFPGIADAFGTTDIVAFDPEGEEWQLAIHDWKFGRGHRVVAKSNAQMAFYACCILEHYGLWDSVKHVMFSICQPRMDDGNTTWIIEIQGLRLFQHALKRAIEGPPDLNVGEWCLFCKGRAICPAQAAAAQRAFQFRAVAGELAQAMDQVEMLEEYIKSVKTAVHDALDAGQPIAGYKLVDKRATTKWNVEDDEALKYLMQEGLTLDEASPREVISAPQAKKALKAIGKELPLTLPGSNRALTIKESSGYTVAPADDKRPEASGKSNAAAEIDALASIINR
jgi:uncharacterized protein DUF2800